MTRRKNLMIDPRIALIEKKFAKADESLSEFAPTR